MLRQTLNAVISKQRKKFTRLNCTRVLSITKTRSPKLVKQTRTPPANVPGQRDFISDVHEMLAEAWNGYVAFQALGQHPRQPRPCDGVALHIKKVADWNKWVLQSTMETLSADQKEPQ